MKPKRIFYLIVLLFTALAITAQQTDAPNADLTYYYRQTGVVRNNTLGAGDNTGQFITFTRRGCYDSDKNGMQAGDGFLAYQGIGNDAHVYEGDTWWGKAFYYFTRDFNKYNVRAPDGVIYVYERATAPASALTSAKVYTKPAPTPGPAPVIVLPTPTPAPPTPSPTYSLPDYSGGSSGSYSGGSSRVSPVGSRTCPVCNGIGQTRDYSYNTPGLSLYCRICGGTYPDHRHSYCTTCRGTGRVDVY